MLLYTCVFIFQFYWILGAKAYTSKALSGFTDLIISPNYCAVTYTLCAKGQHGLKGYGNVILEVKCRFSFDLFIRYFSVGEFFTGKYACCLEV